MNTHVVDQAIAAWYDTIPGGRFTVFLTFVVFLAIVSLAGNFSYQRVLKIKEQRAHARRIAAKAKRNRLMHEAVGQVWHA